MSKRNQLPGWSKLAAPCRGCVYLAHLANSRLQPYCDYLCSNGHMRPCPPGEGCTVKRTRKVRRRRRNA